MIMLVSYLYPFTYTYIVVKVHMENCEGAQKENKVFIHKEPVSLLLEVIEK